MVLLISSVCFFYDNIVFDDIYGEFVSLKGMGILEVSIFFVV